MNNFVYVKQLGHKSKDDFELKIKEKANVTQFDR